MSQSPLETRMQSELAIREKAVALRRLHSSSGVDFCSNDYLGFARSEKLLEDVLRAHAAISPSRLGGTGSRLICGDSRLHEQVEAALSKFLGAAAALLFNSGYDANVGVLSALTKRHDVVLYDELCHASIRDGLRLGFAQHYSFKHNSVEELHKKLERIESCPDRNIFIVCESVYSMGGDEAPLLKLGELAKAYQATLIVDEAHATGIFGPSGAGLCSEHELHESFVIRVHTFGKALGSHGACVCGTESVKEYLLNFSRPFIYSTAVGDFSLLSILKGIEHLQSSTIEGEKLREVITHFRKAPKDIRLIDVSDNRGPIQFVSCPGNRASQHLARFLQSAGFDVRAILSPTVPQGAEGVRICLHAFNTFEQIDQLMSTLTSHFESAQRAA